MAEWTTIFIWTMVIQANYSTTLHSYCSQCTSEWCLKNTASFHITKGTCTIHFKRFFKSFRLIFVVYDISHTNTPCFFLFFIVAYDKMDRQTNHTKSQTICSVSHLVGVGCEIQFFPFRFGEAVKHYTQRQKCRMKNSQMDMRQKSTLSVFNLKDLIRTYVLILF